MLNLLLRDFGIRECLSLLSHSRMELAQLRVECRERLALGGELRFTRRARLLQLCPLLGKPRELGSSRLGRRLGLIATASRGLALVAELL